jgi:hypothetical protein
LKLFQALRAFRQIFGVCEAAKRKAQKLVLGIPDDFAKSLVGLDEASGFDVGLGDADGCLLKDGAEARFTLA